MVRQRIAAAFPLIAFDKISKVSVFDMITFSFPRVAGYVYSFHYPWSENELGVECSRLDVLALIFSTFCRRLANNRDA